MVPAYQRLGAGQATRFHRHLGLVVELEFPAGQAMADLLQELVVGPCALVAVRIEQVVAVLARLLGHVHGLVGMA